MKGAHDGARHAGLLSDSLKLILKNNKGEILALQALETGNLAGYYDLPGGRINADEFSVSLEKILKREIREEIGEIDFRLSPAPVAVGRHAIPAIFAREGKDIRILYLFFKGEYLGGDIAISDEHLGYRWLDGDKIDPGLYFTSGIKEGVEMYLNNQESSLSAQEK